MSQRENVLSRFGRVVAPFACAGLLAACSSTPDWANPVEWYEGAKGVFESEPEPEVAKAREEAAANKQTSPGSDGEFPNLSSVPERPKDLGTQRGQVQQGLAADREQARYADVDTSPQDDGSMSAKPPADAPPPAPAPPGADTAHGAASESAADGGATASVAEAQTRSQTQTQPQTATRQQDETAGTSGSASERAVPHQAVEPMPPRQVAPEVPKPMPEGDEVRRTYEDALQQSAATVTTAPAGLRDMNHSPVVSRRNTMPVPPPSMGEERVTLRPPPGVQPQVQSASVLPAGEADAVVYFDNASARISGSARNELKNIVNTYKERGGHVRVVGHASSRTRNIDEVAHRLANFRVSLDRAQAVARELARLGVPMERISVQAMADNDPVYYEVMPAGEAGNRRAEIFLDY